MRNEGKCKRTHKAYIARGEGSEKRPSPHYEGGRGGAPHHTRHDTTLRKVSHHAKVWGRDAHAKKSHYKGGIRGKWQKKSK